MGLYTTYKKSAEQTVDKENDSIGKKVVGFLTAPVSFKDDVLVSQKTQATNVLVWAGLTFLGGEWLGHRRAANGGQSIVPFFRQ